jgi:hypothetical protein
MLKTIIASTGSRIDYDTDAGTVTRWTEDGSAIAESRPMSNAERQHFEADALPDKVASLTAAVDQLILDTLMGAF